MTNKIAINKLPTKTWNFLDVNFAETEWDSKKEIQMNDDNMTFNNDKHEHMFEINSQGEYSSKKINIKCEEGRSQILEICSPTANLKTDINITMEKNSSVKLVQLLSPSERAVLCHKININCESNSNVELLTIILGDGDTYADHLIDLNGQKSQVNVNTAYLGKNKQTIDYNIVVDHWGESTTSEINVNGALMDSSRKTFRGTIDFKKGSSDSLGSENETVLMLGENVINKTVPLILCAEENVEGTHGATIGELDKDTLFYFESRGIDAESAEKIMAYAAIDRVIKLSENDTLKEKVRNILGSEFDNEE